MYCKKCLYDLGRIESTACPECGRPFDPADPASHDPIVPSRFRAQAVLWGTLAALLVTQLAMLLAHQFVSALPSGLVWIPVAIVPVGAFAAGWYGDRYAPTAVYGAASLLVIFGGLLRYEHLLDELLLHVSLLVDFGLFFGVLVLLMVASLTASRVGWHLHVRWVRFRTTDAGRRQDGRLRRLRQAAVGTAVLLVLAAAWAVVETLRVMHATPSIRVDYGTQADRLCAETAGVEVDAGHAAWIGPGPGAAALRYALGVTPARVGDHEG